MEDHRQIQDLRGRKNETGAASSPPSSLAKVVRLRSVKPSAAQISANNQDARLLAQYGVTKEEIVAALQGPRKKNRPAKKAGQSTTVGAFNFFGNVTIVIESRKR